jgi:hypothetical protein
MAAKKREGEPREVVRYALPESLIWRVKREAADRRCKPNHVIERLLNQYFAERETSVPA